MAPNVNQVITSEYGSKLANSLKWMSFFHKNFSQLMPAAPQTSSNQFTKLNIVLESSPVMPYERKIMLCY